MSAADIGAAIIVGLVLSLLRDEFSGWCEYLASWLVRHNAHRAPPSISTRIEEEWLAHLADMPGRISRLLFAMDCRRAAYVLSHRERLPHVSPLVPVFVRLLDLTLSLVTLLAVCPLIIVTCAALRLAGHSSCFLVRPTVGLGGRRFSKFEFMVDLGELEVNKETGILFGNYKGLSRVGLLLRFTGLHQLPTLFNVVRGDMSLVGPKPDGPNIAKNFAEKIPGYNLRLSVRPGMTGLAQLYNLGNPLSGPRTTIEYDLLFIQNYSLELVAKTLYRTVKIVLFATEI